MNRLRLVEETNHQGSRYYVEKLEGSNWIYIPATMSLTEADGIKVLDQISKAIAESRIRSRVVAEREIP